MAVIAEKIVIVDAAIYLQHQGHPDEKHHESIKHTPAILDIRVIPLCREKKSKRRHQRSDKKAKRERIIGRNK